MRVDPIIIWSIRLLDTFVNFGLERFGETYLQNRWPPGDVGQDFVPLLTTVPRWFSHTEKTLLSSPRGKVDYGRLVSVRTRNSK